VGGEDLLANLLVDPVGQRELELLDEKLLHVWAADVVGLLDLNNLEDLCRRLARASPAEGANDRRTCTDLKRER
jgi:hypothetical protein